RQKTESVGFQFPMLRHYARYKHSLRLRPAPKSPCVDVYGPRPIATGWLDQGHWSQLLTYIRLPDAAGQRLRREPRWVFARFHLTAPGTLAEAMPVHTSGSGSDGVTVSPSPAICCNCWVGPPFPFVVYRLASSCFH